MKFFISSEEDISVGTLFMETRKRINEPLNNALINKSYGEALNEIGIIPIIMPNEYLTNRKERKLFQKKEKNADYRLYIDCKKFINGSDKDRDLLLINNIFKAIHDLERKAKGKFDGKSLINDILKILNVTPEEVGSVE